MARRRPVFLFVCAIAALAAAHPAAAQESTKQRLRESQLRLERIRRQRAELERKMKELQSQVHTVAGELAMIERHAETSAAVVDEIEFQSKMLAARIDTITSRLVRTRDRLRERRVVLRQRLRSIYKRGPLHSVRVLLRAESFGDLLNRYKYLHLIALHDRMLIREVERLERGLAAQERELTTSLARLERLRAEKLEEVARLERLEKRQQQALATFRARERHTEGRLSQLARAEAELTGVIAALEKQRKADARRRTVAGGRAEAEELLTTADIGSLGWPVEGELIYRFGPDRQPNGVMLRWNGVGIAAPVGTRVRAVEAGTVAMAGPFEGYGPTVMISHGGGYYTLYLYLQDVSVRRGERVEARQVIGTVGGAGTPEGPHIEFQVRSPVEGGLPEPVDPLDWLKSRSGR